MEFRNTPPPPPLSERNAESLIEELGNALRNVGVLDHYLPDDPKVRAYVESVAELHGELARRGVSYQGFLEDLSRETTWNLEALLQDCLLFPAVIPYVREADGVRRALRCRACRERESPDRQGLPVCDECLARAIEVSAVGGPLPNFVVFRSYTPSTWCPHADESTILLALDDYDYDFHPSFCRQCLESERQRRVQR